MKKLTALLAATALICGYSTCSNGCISGNTVAAETWEGIFSGDDSDTGTHYVAPDKVTVDSLNFDVYGDHAELTGCEDTSITSVIIPEKVNGVSVTAIVDSPFGYCRQLKSITIPNTLEEFSFFDLCCTTVIKVGSDEEPIPSVAEICVSETNPYYTVDDGILYTKDMKKLVGCPPAIGRKELKISDKAEVIGAYAFAECMGLEKAVIPDNITQIENTAFVACIDLVSVELPENVTEIPADLFYYCQSLKEVNIKGKITTIGMGAFNECTALTNFVIPETVTSIGMNAFENAGCCEIVDGIHYVGNWAVGSDDDIERAVVRQGTVGIADMTFFVRSNIELVDIPASVKYPGKVLVASLSSGKQYQIHYRCSVIDEKTIASAKRATDIYIYDPQCEIFDSEKTIPATYSAKDTEFDEPITGDIVIHGYAGSTAEEYAKKYDRKFEVMEKTVVEGDVNGDGVFNIADVVLLQKWLLSDTNEELADWKAGDLLADDELNAFDLCLMKKKLLNAE